MRRKHLILFGVAGALAGATLTGVVATTSTSEYNVEAVTQYSLTLDSNNFNFDDQLADGFANGSKSFTNKRGNSIQIAYDNAAKYSGGLLNLNANGSIYNPYIEGSEYLNKISGIKDIKVDFDNSIHANLKYEVGWEDQVKDNVYHTTGTLTDNTVANCFNASYFRIINENADPVKINSVVITYSCFATQNPDYFTPGLQFSLDSVNNTYDVYNYTGTSKEIYIPKFYKGVRVTGITGCVSNTEEFYNVYIPASINEISRHAFTKCPNITIYCGQPTDLYHYDEEWTDGDVCIVYGYQGQKTTIDNITYALCVDNKQQEFVGVANVSKTATDARILKEITFVNTTLPVSRLFTDCIFNCLELENIYVPDTILTADIFAIENCPNANIFCEHAIRPDGFNYSWVRENNPIIWGYQNKDVVLDEITYSILKNSDGTEYARISNVASTAKEIKVPHSISYNGKSYDVKILGESTFVNNSTLEVLDLTGIETIYPSAVVNCANLREIKLSPNTRYIYASFKNLPSLKELFVPGSIHSLDYNVLQGCPNAVVLTDATAKPQYWQSTSFGENPVIWGSKNIKIDSADALYYVGTYQEATVAYLAKYKDTKDNFVIPDTVSDGVNSYNVGVISQKSFLKTKTISTLTLGNNILAVNNYAVNENAALKTINLNSNLQYIGFQAFRNNANVDTINGLGENISTIKSEAFQMLPKFLPMVAPETRPYGWANDAFSGLVIYGYQGVKGSDELFKYALVNHNGNIGMLCYDTVTLTNEMKMPDTITIDDVAYDITFLSNVLSNKEGVKTFKIGKKVHTLYRYAFDRWDRVDIYVPSNVTHVDGQLIDGYYYGNIYIQHSSRPSGWPSGWEGYTSSSHIHWGASMG